LKIVGLKIFKHAMKFIESNSGVIAHEICFESLEWQQKITLLKENIDTEFSDALEYGNKNSKNIITNYLSTVSSELHLRFGDWNKLPLQWAALASSKITKAKQLANDFLNRLKKSREQFLSEIDWHPLEQLLSEQNTIEELKRFAMSPAREFKEFNILYTFHRQYFQFPVHNVECERNIASLYRYKLEASAAATSRVSAMC
jgi:hypothetical protein